MELTERRAHPDLPWWPPAAHSRNWTRLALNRQIVVLGVVALTFAVFAPSIWNDFVDWDDQVNLKGNPNFRGLGWAQVKWMFTAILMGHYIPVTWLTFGLDYVLWGMDPRGYHLTNVVLHAANAGLFYLVAERLLARARPMEMRLLRLCAAVAALFFALHPLRAESVAWATERRDVLSGLFALTTILTYIRAAETEGRRRIGLIVAAATAYLLALGSKSIVMSLPLALVVLDVYPLRRLPASWRRWADLEFRHVWREKIAFFALAGLGALVSWYAVAANQFFTPGTQYPLSARIGLVFYSLAFYVRKTVLPTALTPLYELPYTVDLLAVPFAASIAAVVVVGLGLLALRRRCPAALAAAVYYAITIAPVSGLLHAGHQLAHDRYSYLSCLGFALLVGAVPAVAVSLRDERAVQPLLARLAVVGVGVWLAALAFVTVQQVQVWRDTETLWRYAVDADDRCSLCQHNLGYHLLRTGAPPQQVLPHLERAIELRPDRTRAHTVLGMAYARTGDTARALEHFERVLQTSPAAVDVVVHQAIALIDAGRLEDAHARLRHAASINRSDPAVLTNLGNVLTLLGRPAEGLPHLERAVALAPDVPYPSIGLATTLLALGRYDDARLQYDVLMSMDGPTVRSMASVLGARLILEW